MNKTKWLKLLSIINSLPFSPAFIVKYLNEVNFDTNYLNSLNVDKVYYLGDWSLNTEPSNLPAIENFNQIEFIKIKPSFSKRLVKYISDETIDITIELTEKLKKNNIYYETDSYDNIVIYGYR